MSSAHKIAFVSTNKSAWGGSEYLWHRTALRFAGSGHEVKAGIPRWKSLPDDIEQLRKAGIDVHFTTDIPGHKKLFNRFLPSGMQFNYVNDGYRFLLSFRPELTVVNQGGNWGGIDLMEFCADNKLRYVTISQAANEAKWPDDSSSERLYRGLKNAEVNFYVSRANIRLSELQAAGSISNAKVVFNPFNVGYEYSSPYPDTGGGYRLANVARHEIFAKGQDILFQVLSDRKWKERDLTVSLYGKGEHSGNIRRLMEHFGLDKVKIEGHIPPEEIWNSNHGLILSSRYEGLPLALVEAMLSARVPVVTAVSGNPEVVEDNVNGFLAGAATPLHLDEALERAWKRRSEWKDLGIKAGESIRKTVPADPVEMMYEEIIKTL
ncbi:MAG: glycosyltransferase family 4 protein [Ignavibacteria bacterium]|nr:glycosyltransferase family 4 protein [Ignavibacteria bacterium]